VLGKEWRKGGMHMSVLAKNIEEILVAALSLHTASSSTTSRDLLSLRLLLDATLVPPSLLSLTHTRGHPRIRDNRKTTYSAI
jgi:hypothetical protein